LVDVAGESRVQITIVEDVAARTNIVRIILLAATKRKVQNRSGEARYEGPYLKEFNLPTPPLTPGGISHRQSKGQRSIIVDDAISISVARIRHKSDVSGVGYSRLHGYLWILVDTYPVRIG
jgi:hypothetical protein